MPSCSGAWPRRFLTDSLSSTVSTIRPGRRWTYGELLAIAETTARALQRHFEPGERVAVWEINRPEWVMLQLGAALSGVVLVTVNPQYRASELQYALGQSGAAGLFHGPVHRGVSMPDAVASVRGAAALRTVIAFDDWDEFLAGGDPAAVLVESTLDDPCVIIYTSGTTGQGRRAAQCPRRERIAVISRAGRFPGG